MSNRTAAELATIDRHMSWCEGRHDDWDCFLETVISWGGEPCAWVRMYGCHCDSQRLEVEGSVYDGEGAKQLAEAVAAYQERLEAARVDVDCDLHLEACTVCNTQYLGDDMKLVDGEWCCTPCIDAAEAAAEDDEPLVCGGCHKQVDSVWAVNLAEDRIVQRGDKEVHYRCPTCCADWGIALPEEG